jgi:hypothetical protein
LVHKAGDSYKDWNELSKHEIESKESRCKKILNFHAIEYMTKEMWHEIDPNREILDWF